MQNNVQYLRIRQVADVDLRVVNKLLARLYEGKLSPKSTTLEILEKCLQDPLFFLYVAVDIEDTRRIFGMGVLIITPQLTGFAAEIHDVAVAREYSGNGIGKGIINALLTAATDFRHQKMLDSIEVSLTSRPERIAANRLYQLFIHVIQVATRVMVVSTRRGARVLPAGR